MNWLSLAMSIVSALLQIYMVLLFIRIVLNWLSVDVYHPLVARLASVTDPYLNWFRRFRFLVVNGIDFSPLAALLVINFLASIAQTIRTYGQVTIGITVAILIHLIWSAIGFFLIVYAALAAVRFLSLRFRWSGQMVWNIVDAFLQPAAYAVARLTGRGKLLPYPTALIFLGVLCLLLWVGGEIGFTILGNIVAALPL